MDAKVDLPGAGAGQRDGALEHLQDANAADGLQGKERGVNPLRSGRELGGSDDVDAMAGTGGQLGEPLLLNAASYPAGALLMLILLGASIPVLFCSVYASYRDIFAAAPPGAHRGNPFLR